MHAEIVALGTELTTGEKLDTNSQWLSLELGEIGIPVDYHATVGDSMQGMVNVLREAAKRSDLVLITGGLGPTLDDLTRQAMAEMAGVELELHQPSLEHIKSLFARRNREMPARNSVQAMFPHGSAPIFNPRGSAPGIWMELPADEGATACTLIALPGVPSEMKRMFHQEVLPKLPGGNQVIKRARINCFGLGESTAEEMLGDLTARGRDPEVGITAHEATITLRITAHGESAAVCDQKINKAKAIVRERLQEAVFGEEDDELEHVVVRQLNDRSLTLSTAESGTGGLLAHRLTEVEGFESCYLGGIVAPTDAAKQELLSVEEALLQDAGPISAEVAGEMARGCRDRFGTDFALAITECPRFDPDDTGAETPAAFIALAGEDLLEVRQHSLVGDPAIAKSRAAKTALNLLRRHLLHPNSN